MLKESEQWDQWEENPIVVIPNKPVNAIQAKIDQYRQQASKPPEVTEEQQQNFFEVIISDVLITLGMCLIFVYYFRT